MSVGAALALAALILAAGGCTSRNLRPIADEAEFQREVLHCDIPVIVDFYKGGGCPTCELAKPTLDQLADEYRGRVKFVSFEYLRIYFAVTSDKISELYHVGLYPTVVLVVDGQERNRWALDYNIDDYRKALDEVLKNHAPKGAAAGTPGPVTKS